MAAIILHMRKFLLVLFGILLLLALLLWWYLKTQQTRKVEVPAVRQDSLPVKVSESVFRLPVSYSIAGLQNFINGKISGEFLETTLSPTGNEKDQIRVEMQKAGQIKLLGRRQQLMIRFPLKVKVTLIDSRMRFITKGLKPVETTVVLLLKTPASLDTAWHLKTKFTLDSVQWVESPAIQIAGVKIDLTKKLDRLIDERKQDLTQLLDVEINKAVSLREPVGKIWKDLQKPITIAKSPAPVFLRFVCRDIGGEFRISGNALVCFTTIRAVVVIVPGSEIRAPVRPLPSFKQSPYQGSLSDTYVYAFLEFDVLNQHVQDRLQGKTFTGKRMAATIREVRVFPTDSGLAVHAKAAGDIEGELVATGTPVFDSVTQHFSLQRFQFQLASSSGLINAGESLLHNRIRDSLQKNLVIGLDDQIKRIPDIIETAISKGRTGKTIEVSMNRFKIKSCEVDMGAKRIHLVVHATFAGGISLKHLRAGKAIRIAPTKKKGIAGG